MTKSYHHGILCLAHNIEVVYIKALFTEAEHMRIQEFLSRVKTLVKTGEYTIQRSWKNNEFEDKYPLRDSEKRRILESLEVKDCIKIDKNTNPRYEVADVFVFVKEVVILAYGEEEQIPLYIKMYIRERNRLDVVVVISFHRAGFYD